MCHYYYYCLLQKVLYCHYMSQALDIQPKTKATLPKALSLVVQTELGKDFINNLSIKQEECKILCCILRMDSGSDKEDVEAE